MAGVSSPCPSPSPWGGIKSGQGWEHPPQCRTRDRGPKAVRQLGPPSTGANQGPSARPPLLRHPGGQNRPKARGGLVASCWRLWEPASISCYEDTRGGRDMPPPTPLVARSLQVGACAVPQGGLEPTLLPCSRGEALSDSRAAAPCPHPCLPRPVRPAPSGASPPLLRDPGLSPAPPHRRHQHMPPQPGPLPGLPTGPTQSPVDKGRPGPRTLRGSRRTGQEGRPLLTGQKSQASGRK